MQTFTTRLLYNQSAVNKIKATWLYPQFRSHHACAHGLIMNRQEEEDILNVARKIKDAASYGVVTDYVFVDGVHFGRVYVWHLLSCRLYTLLRPAERIKINSIYNQKWWTLFLRSNYHNKFILLLSKLVWCFMWINI